METEGSSPHSQHPTTFY